MAVGRLDPLPRLVRNQVGRDEARAARIREISGETFHTVMEDEVPIAHDERDAPGIGHRLHGAKHVGDTLAVAQRNLAGRLDHRAVHDRVGIRQADLHDIHAVVDHSAEGLKRQLRVGESKGQIADEGGHVALFVAGEELAATARRMADAQRLARGGAVLFHFDDRLVEFTHCCPVLRSLRVPCSVHRSDSQTICRPCSCLCRRGPRH